MGLFSFLKGKKENREIEQEEIASNQISKELFVDESEPNEAYNGTSKNDNVKGINMLYNFLQDDYESRGYSDALINPDDSYKLDNINLIKYDLEIMIERVSTYYSDLIREIDFHIGSRSRAGLIDLVEQLNAKKENVIAYIAKVDELESNMRKGEGVVQRLILSYQRGFMRGLSVITQSKVMNLTL